MILWKLKKFYSKYLLTILFLWLLSFIIISCSKPTNRVKNDDKKYNGCKYIVTDIERLKVKI